MKIYYLFLFKIFYIGESKESFLIKDSTKYLNNIYVCRYVSNNLEGVNNI
jgi:hypothetical protein